MTKTNDETNVDIEEIFLRKAARGRGIVETDSRYRANNDNVADVLLDLMAYSVQHGVDFSKELETAKRWYRQDVKHTRYALDA